MCSLTHKLTHYCRWADTAHRMSKSCHTTLFVLECPRHFLPVQHCGKGDREARNTLQPQILPHFCITHCDIYSTETNPPPTPEFSHNSALFLTHAVSSRGWQKSSSLLLRTRLSVDRERKRAWGSHACPSALGAGSGTCHFLSQAFTWPRLCVGGREVSCTVCLQGEEWRGQRLPSIPSCCFRWEVTWGCFPPWLFIVSEAYGLWSGTG